MLENQGLRGLSSTDFYRPASCCSFLPCLQREARSEPRSVGPLLCWTRAPETQGCPTDFTILTQRALESWEWNF